MAFTVQDFSDLTRLLAKRPEWRSELRRLLLSDELLTLPQAVRELVEAQQRAEERLQHVEERLQHVEERLSRLEIAVEKLTEQVSKLTEAQHRTADTVGRLKGQMLELTYRNKAWAYFGPLLRRMRVVEPHTLEDTLETELTPGEFRDLLRMDLLLTGLPRLRPDIPEVLLAVEISSVVDQNDVDRAERRAKLLRQAGYRALPVAAGEQMTQGAEESAHTQKVVLLQDGEVLFWEEALDAWAA